MITDVIAGALGVVFVVTLYKHELKRRTHITFTRRELYECIGFSLGGIAIAAILFGIIIWMVV